MYMTEYDVAQADNQAKTPVKSLRQAAAGFLPLQFRHTQRVVRTPHGTASRKLVNHHNDTTQETPATVENRMAGFTEEEAKGEIMASQPQNQE